MMQPSQLLPSTCLDVIPKPVSADSGKDPTRNPQLSNDDKTKCFDVKPKPITTWCTSCAEAEASGWCQDCQLYLCEEEVRVHKKASKTRNHTIHSLPLLKTDSPLPSPSTQLQGKPSLCFKCGQPSHKAEELKHYCLTCEKLVCVYCIHYDHPRPQHNTFLIAEAKHMLDDFKSDMNQALNNIKTMQTKIKESLSLVVERERQLNMAAEITSQQVIATFTHLKRCLDERQNELLSELQQIKKTKLATLSVHKQNLEMIIGAVDSTFLYWENGIDDDVQLLDLRSTIKKQLEEVAEMNAAANQQPEDDMKIDAKMEGCDDLENRIGKFGRLISEPVSVKQSLTASTKDTNHQWHSNSQPRPPLSQYYGPGVTPLRAMEAPYTSQQASISSSEHTNPAPNRNYTNAQSGIEPLGSYYYGQGAPLSYHYEREIAHGYQRESEAPHASQSPRWTSISSTEHTNPAPNQNYTIVQSNPGQLFHYGQQDYQQRAIQLPPGPLQARPPASLVFTDQLHNHAGKVIAHEIRDEKNQEAVGQAVHGLAQKRPVQSAVGEALASNTDNPVLAQMARNEAIQSSVASAIAGAATNKAVQERPKSVNMSKVKPRSNKTKS